MKSDKPNVSKCINEEHLTVHDMVKSLRSYYSEESKYSIQLAKNGDENDKRVAREISRVMDNVDRICRIAESYAESHGIRRE